MGNVLSKIRKKDFYIFAEKQHYHPVLMLVRTCVMHNYSTCEWHRQHKICAISVILQPE